MATYRFNPPLQLRNDPSWTIVSLDEVAELLDGEAARFRDQIKHCATPETAANLGSTLRDWAIRKRLVAAPLH
jgi:hypothetical protein